MTPEQLQVLNIIRVNPYFCKNANELKHRTRSIKNQIEAMLPVLQQRLQTIDPHSADNEQAAMNILHEEMSKLLQKNHNAIIVKADVQDEHLTYIHKDHQAYLIYFFLTNSINPYMATLSVAPTGIISFYNPPGIMIDNEPLSPTNEPLNMEISRQLCEILHLPLSLLENGPEPSYQQAS